MKRTEKGSVSTLVGGPTVCITGNIQATSDVNIACDVNGNITSDCAVKVSAGAVIKGDIIAEDIVIENGEIFGNLTATKRVIICKEAVVKGDVNTQDIVVDEGAILIGTCVTGLRDPRDLAIEASNM